jgi:hypothetical protein
LIAKDLGSLVTSPTPFLDEPATFLSNKGFASRQRMPNRRPSAEKGGLSGYANHFKPLSESFSTTYRGKKRSKTRKFTNNKNTLALDLIKEMERSEKIISFWRKEVQEMDEKVGKWEAQGIAWSERGQFTKQQVAETEKSRVEERINELFDWITSEEIRMNRRKDAIRQFSLRESEAATRSTSRHGSDELVGPPPTPGKADTLDNEVF